MADIKQHPITPPRLLRQLWAQQAQRLAPHDPVAWLQYVADKAAQWGADQELEACVQWTKERTIQFPDGTWPQEVLRAARRPKPPVTAEQALQALRLIPIDPENGIGPSGLDTIRAALERLQQLEQLP